MKMRKSICAFTAAILAVGAAGISAFAEPEPETVEVTVTIADDKGELAVERETVEVTDVNDDDKITLYDVFVCTHDVYYESGRDGFDASVSQYGWGITKLWGVENGGGYGYYVNDTMAMGLSDVVEEGDDVYAYIYQDLKAYSDKYSFFDKKEADIDLDEEDGTLTLSLKYMSFDANYNPVATDAAGAYITIDGEKTEYTTDAEGNVTLTFDEAGDYVVSAGSDDMILVPPICKVSVTKTEETDDPEDPSDDDSINVTVTIADDKSEIVVAGEYVEVYDVNDDNQITLYDVFVRTHDEFYDGESEAGFGAAVSDYGWGITKLWGIENGGGYGYYVNDQMSMGLGDVVEDGDYVYAFVYTDLAGYSDKYAFFDKKEEIIDLDEDDGTLTLTLKYYSYDENYNLVENAAKGAVITINGEKTEYVTDDEGKVTLTFDEAGLYNVSAVSDDMILTPPLCAVSVLKTGDTDGGEETDTDTDPEDGKDDVSPDGGDIAPAINPGVGDVVPSDAAAPVNPKTGSTSAVLGLISLAAAGIVLTKRNDKKK